MAKQTLYPTKITQPNKNQDSGLDKICFKAVESKNNILTVTCRDQKDPKRHHQWTNTSNLKEGGVAQCGHVSSYNCSTKTYYGIGGYRNTCPIAGVTGTYTQPAKLRLYFNPIKKGIPDGANINSVTLKFKHRRIGVDVSNNKSYDSFGPNFCGYDTYPKRKVLKVKFAGETKEYNKNPPLSFKTYSEVTLKFTDVDFDDLNKGYMDIIYGNNLSTNPGNIYIKGLSIEVDYTAGSVYLEGKQSSKTLYTSDEEECQENLTFTMEAGYKINEKKIPPKKAPKILNKKITCDLPDGAKLVSKTFSDDNKTATFVIKDTSNKEKKKTVVFKVSGENKKKKMSYTSKVKPKPTIAFPTTVEHNVKPNSIPNILNTDGCTHNVKIYDGDYKHPIAYNNKNDFYKKLATEKECGEHTLIFKMGPTYVVKHKIEIIPTVHDFKILYNEETTSSLRLAQNKNKNETCQIIYNKNKTFYSPPVFNILNPTYGKIVDNVPSSLRVDKDVISWNIDTDGLTKNVTIGTYYPGDYIIEVSEVDTLENCKKSTKQLNIHIDPSHIQSFDSVFVRGEDTTAFDYQYLVALEGDTLQQPLYVEGIILGDSYNDIHICTQQEVLSGISQDNYLSMEVTNKTSKSIKNLLLELNILNETDDEFEVSTKEWVTNEGLFYNFVENFSIANKDYEDIVSVENLTPDDNGIEEEDVYLHIKELNPQDKISLKLPFRGYFEKEIYLQVRLFGEPMILYPLTDCSNKQDSFDKVHIKVFDSIVTDMNISGDIDLLSVSTTIEDCPYECFKNLPENGGITYSIKNIDSSDLNAPPTTIIKNDPRVIPYKISYKGASIQYNQNGEKITNEEQLTYNTPTLVDFDGYDYGIRPIYNNETVISEYKSEEDMYINVDVLYPTPEEEDTDEEEETIEEENNNSYIIPTKLDIYINGTKIDKQYESRAVSSFVYNLKDINEYLLEGANTLQFKYIDEEMTSESYVYGTLVIIKKSEIPFELIYNKEAKKQSLLRGVKVDCIIDFDESANIIADTPAEVEETEESEESEPTEEAPDLSNRYPQKTLSKYTNSEGEAIFFIDIPPYIGKTYNTQNVPCTFVVHHPNSHTEKIHSIIEYQPGQSIPLKVKCYTIDNFIDNRIVFNPNIIKAGTKDSLTVYYRICNLVNNQGIFKTTFKTDDNDYTLVPNSVSENIYCGINTDTKVYTRLKEIIIEQTKINRLYVYIRTPKRFNKDISVLIKENNNDINKYNLINYNIENGDMVLNTDSIIWNIDYLEPNTTIVGYFDFKAIKVGLSKIEITTDDFLSKNYPNLKFGKDSYICKCRKKLEERIADLEASDIKEKMEYDNIPENESLMSQINDLKED